MDDAALLRYSRHLLLPEIGIEGQERIGGGKVLIVGAGGLGCPAAWYLVSAGIGRLFLADDDVVDETNLQRQTLYDAACVGQPKVLAARAALARVNPLVEVVPLQTRLEGDRLAQAVLGADLVLDCSDNFPTRHAVNRVCVAAGKPLFSGSAIRFSGQIAVFDRAGRGGPCYRCLFPEEAEDEELRCAVMGVFAPLTGLIGTALAAEAIKWLAGLGTALSGRLVLFDALTMQWRTLTVARDPSCPVCGAQAQA
jgi:adenylyltransferase/sulfurtransferase